MQKVKKIRNKDDDDDETKYQAGRKEVLIS